MKVQRLSKGVTEHYTSFEELGKAWGCKPVIKQTKDKTKLEKQRENFCKSHLCPACKKPMVYIEGMNMLVCKNESCKGIKHEFVDNIGETKIYYTPSFNLLDEKSTEIATNIFMEVN